MRNLKMIRIGANGQQLEGAGNDHVAVFLPDFGLTFTARPINKGEASQYDLEKLAAEFTLPGHGKFGLPEIDELSLLIDYTRRSPAINTDYFLDIPNDWLWSKTGYVTDAHPAGSPSVAWFVNFHYGFVYAYNRNNRGFALAVSRPGQ